MREQLGEVSEWMGKGLAYIAVSPLLLALADEVIE